ncbi:MAG: 30S ribosome-binding factor RbfA [Candidatus Sumerlaeia bacterium]|nr:30S ribosome-binding factor RbfA [Candidatus Sumerlaeia bacterium]
MTLSHRPERVGEEIKNILATVVTQEMRDPRMPALLTVTHVKVAPDFSVATVYFTQIPEDEAAIGDTIAALESAAGFLQSAVARQLTLRHHPKLRFRYDESVARYARIEEVLKRTRPVGGVEPDAPTAPKSNPDEDTQR